MSHRKLEQLACRMLSGTVTQEELEHDWSYRKGKRYEHVKQAVSKGFERGSDMEDKLFYIAFELDPIIYPRGEGK